MPVFIFIRRQCCAKKYRDEVYESDILAMFTEKLVSVVKLDTVRVTYEMSDLLRGASDEEIASLAIQSIEYLTARVEFVRRVSC